MGRAVRERREYVLPARFDDTPLPGLPPDVSYIDLRGRMPQQFAATIAAKLAGLGTGPSSSLGQAEQARRGAEEGGREAGQPVSTWWLQPR